MRRRVNACTVSRLIAPLVVATGVAACAAQSASQPTAVPSSAAANPAPAASNVPAQLQFSAKTVDGQDFRGQSLFGKPAVLWFWAPWCAVCQGEAPEVGQIAAALPAVTFIGVAGLDQLAAMQDFVAKFPVNALTNLADTDGAVWAKFGVTHQPAFAFVRPDGVIGVVQGPMSGVDLTKRVAALTES